MFQCTLRPDSHMSIEKVRTYPPPKEEKNTESREFATEIGILLVIGELRLGIVVPCFIAIQESA